MPPRRQSWLHPRWTISWVRCHGRACTARGAVEELGVALFSRREHQHLVPDPGVRLPRASSRLPQQSLATRRRKLRSSLPAGAGGRTHRATRRGRQRTRSWRVPRPWLRLHPPGGPLRFVSSAIPAARALAASCRVLTGVAPPPAVTEPVPPAPDADPGALILTGSLPTGGRVGERRPHSGGRVEAAPLRAPPPALRQKARMGRACEMSQGAVCHFFSPPSRLDVHRWRAPPASGRRAPCPRAQPRRAAAATCRTHATPGWRPLRQGPRSGWHVARIPRTVRYATPPLGVRLPRAI